VHFLTKKIEELVASTKPNDKNYHSTTHLITFSTKKPSSHAELKVKWRKIADFLRQYQ
jgi:hypothetical protein